MQAGQQESEQSHRMAWVGRDLKHHPVPTPCMDSATQGPIQPGLECLQGWGTHSFFGQQCSGQDALPFTTSSLVVALK